jgi:Family of unknown function (DUF6311)
MYRRAFLMIREKKFADLVDGLLQRIRRAALAELPDWQLVVLAAATGAIWAASLFDWSFVSGQDAFWQFPAGTITGSQSDMAQVLVGYYYYVQSAWRLPLFFISALGTPAGTNVVFMDVVPIVALVGKVVHSVTGLTINPYGVYVFLCFSLPGVMMTLLLIAAGVRQALAAILAAIFANATPALLWRWGHTALLPQFVLIAALALYLFSVKRPARKSVSAVWIGYLGLANLVDIYLFVMVGVVWLCTVIQRRLNGLITTREALGIGTLTVALVTAIMIVGGQLGAGNGLPFARGYGDYSMNLLSPLLPQKSGLFPGVGGVIDATGGQYEGFNYFGLGLLMASLLVLPAEISWLRQNLRRHAILALAFAAMTAFAISHRVYAGNRLLFELPLPDYIVWGLGIFRANGRFFWLIGYAQLAMALVLGFRRARPVVVLGLVAAAMVQIADVQPLRAQIVASIAAGPGKQELDRAKIARLVAEARRVEDIPSMRCTVDVNDPAYEKRRRANMELMLAAARSNVPTNTVYSSRINLPTNTGYSSRSIDALTIFDLMRERSRIPQILTAAREQYCKREIDAVRNGGGPGDLVVLLSDQLSPEKMGLAGTCHPLSWARYCMKPAE